MIDIGFEGTMKSLVKFVPTNVQMCIFSSSCPSGVRKFNDFCLRNPVEIRRGTPSGEMKDFEHDRFQAEKGE